MDPPTLSGTRKAPCRRGWPRSSGRDGPPGTGSRARFTADQVEADFDRLKRGQEAAGGWTFDWLARSPEQVVESRCAVTVLALATCTPMAASSCLSTSRARRPAAEPPRTTPPGHPVRSRHRGGSCRGSAPGAQRPAGGGSGERGQDHLALRRSQGNARPRSHISIGPATAGHRGRVTSNSGPVRWIVTGSRLYPGAASARYAAARAERGCPAASGDAAGAVVGAGEVEVDR
jgi:hypothetical protein